MFLLTFTFIRDTILSRQSGSCVQTWAYVCVYVYVCRFIIYQVFRNYDTMNGQHRQ